MFFEHITVSIMPYYINPHKPETKVNYKVFHNQVVKDRLYRTYCRGPVLVELACGSAHDLSKWNNCGVKKVYGFDIDLDNIQNSRRIVDEAKWIRRDLETEFSLANCAEPMSFAFPDFKEIADTVSCQFALHYFCGSDRTILNFFDNVSWFLKPGGYLICTTTIGSRMMREWEAGRSLTGSFWSFRPGQGLGPVDIGFPVLTTISTIGQTIQEYLVPDLSILERYAEQSGLRVMQSVPFQDIWESLDIAHPKYGQVHAMTEDEKRFSFLFQTIVFQKYLEED